MKVLAAIDRDALQSQSQLVFVGKGLRTWLHAAQEINAPSIQPREVASPRTGMNGMDPTMIALIADIALNTWKGVIAC